MKTVVIENPILNSPFEMPRRHFKFDKDKITDQIVEGRRASSYFVPIASPKKKGKQSDPDLFPEELKEHDDINFIRSRVDLWRDHDYRKWRGERRNGQPAAGGNDQPTEAQPRS